MVPFGFMLYVLCFEGDSGQDMREAGHQLLSIDHVKVLVGAADVRDRWLRAGDEVLRMREPLVKAGQGGEREATLELRRRLAEEVLGSLS